MTRIALAVFLTVTSSYVTSAYIEASDTKKPDRQVSAGTSPYLFLIRDSAVHLELRLNNLQRAAIRKLTDELDGPLWAIRNKSLEEGTLKLRKLIAKAKDSMSEILTTRQQKRLEQVVLQYQGSRAVLRPDVAARLKLTDDQIERIEQVFKQTDKAVGELQTQANNGKSRKPIDGRLAKHRRDETRKTLATMSRNQRNQWSTLLGKPVDTSRFGEGLLFKAPEISDSKDWINSRPLWIENLRGQVVAVHFYAFGWINCVRNDPWYRDWHNEFSRNGLTIIGIHTPETSAERNVESVRQKAKENEMLFPIVVDNDKKNWNAWGNSMWPSVYLIDKKGYVRYWWYGELNWQGAGGQKIMRKHIAELIAEKE